MADKWYWDIINGDDGNDGTAITDEGGGVGPVRTLSRVHSISSDGDRVIIGPGVYPSSVTSGAGSFNITKDLMFTPQKAGKVIFDFENQLPSAGHITFSTGSGQFVFKGIEFRNMGVGKYALYRTGGSSLFVEDCVFHQRDGAANTGRGVRGTATVEYCSFYNLERGCTSVTPRCCYFKSVTTPLSSSVGDYNAYPGNTETNGINTSTGIDPGFVDAAAGDFRLALDPTGYAEEYLTMGEFGGSIGASGASGPWWDARFPQSRWMVPDPTPGDGMVGVWQNDASYEDPGGAGVTGIIVEDTGDFEPIVDLSGSGNPAALSGRLLSPVIDWGTDSVTLEHAPIAAFRDPGAGAEIDTDTSYPAKAEYRQSSTSFLWDDPESTDLVWVEFELHEKLNLTLRYQQFRVTFQVAHTGA